MFGLFRISALAGLVALLAGSVVTPATSAPMAWSPERVYHQPPWVLTQGEPVTLAYGFVDRGIAVYARNNLEQRYTRVPLVRARDSSGLWVARVPGSLVRGSSLFYYAVLRDPGSGRSVTIPARGASGPQRVWIVDPSTLVPLGTHTFGRLATPDAIVAHAGPNAVGFACCADPPGGDGPSSFDVARNGSIWLLDKLGRRLLVWSAGHPKRLTRTIPLRLPRDLGLRDFALGADGTIYVDGSDGHLYALTAGGEIRWSEPMSGGGPLRVGPDGVLYARRACGVSCAPFGGNEAPASVPLTTPAGAPLPPGDQIRGTSPFQSLPGGLRLVTWALSHWSSAAKDLEPTGEVRFALVDRADRVVRAWRVTSETRLTLSRLAPALVGRDLVVSFDVSQQTNSTFSWERFVLRLGHSGATRQVALDSRSVFGAENLDSTPLRIGTDGRLYQLRSDRKSGVSVARYSLSAAATAA
jgi:hypothetical protein